MRTVKIIFAAMCTAIAALLTMFITEPSNVPGGYRGFGLLLIVVFVLALVMHERLE
jgi:hypothetical protein